MQASRIVYLSDVSKISERAWDILRRPVSLAPSLYITEKRTSLSNTSTAADLVAASITSSKLTRQPPTPTLVIIDCLRPTHYSSHFGLGDAYSTCRRLLHPDEGISNFSGTHGSSDRQASSPGGRAYMVGFSHEFTMAEWTCVGDVLAGRRVPSEFTRLMQTSGDGEDNWKKADGGIRPAYIVRALDSLVDVVPSISHPRDPSIQKAEFSDNLISEEERLWMKPAWDGIRLILRGGKVFDDDFRDSKASSQPI